jgi:hypothetical protein
MKNASREREEDEQRTAKAMKDADDALGKFQATSQLLESTKTTISVSDFQIVSYRTVREFDSLKVKGEVKNNGTVPAGVQLQAVARDEKGNAIDTTKFWPNSVSNIPPGGTVGVSSTVSHGPFAKTIDLQVVAVRVWGAQ